MHTRTHDLSHHSPLRTALFLGLGLTAYVASVWVLGLMLS